MLKEKYKEWSEVFKMKKKYSQNFPFCFYDLAANYLPEDKSAVVIDIGCGECRFENYLKLWDKYENLTVLDGNPDTVEKIRKKRKFSNVLRYTVPDRLPFEDESVEYIFCGHLIEHLHFEQLYKLFKELDRVLRVDGILVVSTPMMWVGFFGNLDHIKPYAPSVFTVYFCGLESGDASYKLISKDYKVEDLVYRYHTHLDFSDSIGSSIKIFDFLIQGLRYISRELGIKRYTRSGYTIILRKGK